MSCCGWKDGTARACKGGRFQDFTVDESLAVRSLGAGGRSAIGWDSDVRRVPGLICAAV